MKQIKYSLKNGHKQVVNNNELSIGPREIIPTGFYYCEDNKCIVYYINQDNFMPNLIKPGRLGKYYSRVMKNEENDVDRGDFYTKLSHLSFNHHVKGRTKTFLDDLIYIANYVDGIDLFINFLVNEELYEIAACIKALIEDAEKAEKIVSRNILNL